MKFVIYIATFLIGLATIVEAAPQNFTYSGIETKKGGYNCDTWMIGYTVVEDTGAERKGSFEVKGCLGSRPSLDDGTFKLDLDRNKYTAELTESSSKSTLKGRGGERRGHVAACRTFACPPPTVRTCIFGAGPDGVEPRTKDCGLSG